jgi:cytoskeletal protein RodZ
MNTNPYTAPPAPRPPDSRKLYKRKRVWAGGFLLLVIGSGIGSSGNNTESVDAKPAVHVTATATQTVTSTPQPKVTVTKTAKPKPAPTVTVTKTAHAASSNTGSSSYGSSSDSGTSTGTCSITSNSGNCYSAGQYCRNSDHGATTTNAAGTSITCRYRSGGWRWSY